MFAEPEFWVAVGFVILMGVFAYVGVHRTVLTALDHRSERIKSELDDARRLKQEAANLLPSADTTTDVQYSTGAVVGVQAPPELVEV